jgi:hypothetical protein
MSRYFDAQREFGKYYYDQQSAEFAAIHEHEIEQGARRLSEYELCKEYHDVGSPAAKREIIRRKLLTPNEWKLVQSHWIRIGMSETALICSWGSSTETNRTVLANSVHEQYVYDGTYVYVENGKIVAYQD